MLNRRGWSPFVSCRSCGRGWGCPECDVSLVVHKGSGRLRCHHCGHSEALPESCPDCGSVTLARHGAGTERVAELIGEAASPLPVFRLLRSAAPAGAHLDILRRFEASDAGVLVGTQMVGKGHDFPDVVLSVVLDAAAADAAVPRLQVGGAERGQRRRRLNDQLRHALGPGAVTGQRDRAAVGTDSGSAS